MDLACNQGAWRQTGKTEKHKPKHDPVKQREDTSQLQIARKVHVGFGLAGSNGEPAPLQLQTMGRCPLLFPPVGARALQVLGLPMHGALMMGKVFGGYISVPVILQKPPIRLSLFPAWAHLRHILAGPATLPRVSPSPNVSGESLFSCFLCLCFASLLCLRCFPQEGSISWILWLKQVGA